MKDRRLLNEVIEAHGGEEYWAGIQAIRIQIRIGGNILAMKFKSPRTRRIECHITTKEIHVEIKPFPRAGLKGIFDGESVWIETSEGQVLSKKKIRRDIDGKVDRKIIWDDLDLLYFASYAIWNYTVTPFVFLWPGFECSEGTTWQEKDGSILRRLNIRYPLNFPTHCREQAFYFDEKGLLRRLDYTAEIFSDLARGAHYCEGHRRYGKLIFPAHRVVYARSGSGHPFRFIKVMEGWIDNVEIVPA